MTKIGIILGSDSDLPYMEKGIQTLKELKIPFEIEVSSAHRTPNRTGDYCRSRGRGPPPGSYRFSYITPCAGGPYYFRSLRVGFSLFHRANAQRNTGSCL